MVCSALRKYLVAAIFSGILAVNGFSQGTSGSFTGTVHDSSGAIVPQVAVIATNVNSRVVFRTTSNEAGIYTLSALPPATYTLTIEAGGFKRVTTNALSLEVNQVARLDFTLEVGAVTETVEVIGLAPVLQTESTQLR